MNKKEIYIKHKKRIKSFLALGTTVSAISLFAIFTEISISGAIGFIFGLIVLYFAYKSKKITLEIEKYCLKQCPICNEEIIKTEEIRYFVADNLVNEEAFNSQKNNKIKRHIYYYKCEKCNFCMTVIKSYLYTKTKEKELNDKVQLDFEYNGDY